jgi:hypothetical protein
MKLCKKCHSSKDESEFTFDKNKKDELSIYCKDCQKLIREKYKGKYNYEELYKDKRKQNYEENKEKIKEYYNDNIDKIKEYGKQYREDNKEKYKGKYTLTDEQKQKYKENYKKKHPPKPLKEKKLKPIKVKKEKKVNKYPFISALKSRLNNVNKNFNTNLKLIDLLGCSLDDFKINLESQFHDWISWDNYGLSNKKNINYWIIELINKNLNTPQKLLHHSNFKIKTFPTIKKPKIPRVLTEEQKLRKKLYWKGYRQIHKDRYRINHRIYKNLKKETDPIFRLKEVCRKIIGNSIRRNGYTKKSRTHEILGCLYEDFKNHIESQFETWMNWDNYGLCNNEFNYGWDIDHIVPLASAKSEEELLKLNHYTNLRPLCSHVNRNLKRDRLDF